LEDRKTIEFFKVLRRNFNKGGSGKKDQMRGGRKNLSGDLPGLGSTERLGRLLTTHARSGIISQKVNGKESKIRKRDYEQRKKQKEREEGKG